MTRDRILRYAPLIALAVVLIVSFWRLFIGGAFFWGLPALQFVPWRAYGFDLLRGGNLPLWNPYNGAGAPLFANYQSAFLYPLNWFGVLAPNNAALGWLMSVTAVLHLFIAGCGMWLFAGRVGLTDVGRGVSALAFALTSYVVARLGTYPIISVTAWLPFLLWAVQRVIEQGRSRDAAWLALFAALVLTAGHAQTAWYALLLAGIYSVWLVISQHRAAWLRLLIALGGVLLGAGVAGMQLIATADLLANSQRAAGFGAQAAALNFSYAPLRLPNLIAPNVYGNPGDGSYLPPGLFYEEAVYVGLIPLIAAVTAVLAWVGRLFRRRTDDESAEVGAQHAAPVGFVPFWLVILVVAFVFALGRYTPIYPFLYRNVPTFDMFQAPGRWHLWTVFALSVLAGVGVSQWGAGKWVIFWTRLVTAGAVAAGVLALASPQFLPPDTLAIAGVQLLIREVAITALWVALAGVLTLLYAPNIPERFHPLPAWWATFWAVLVIVVVSADLGWATRGLNPTVPATFYNPLPDPPANPNQRAYWTQDALRLTLYGERQLEDGTIKTLTADELGFEPWLSGGDYRIAQENWREFRRLNLPNMNLLDRTYLLNNFDPLLLASFAAIIDALPEDDAAKVEPLRTFGVSVIYTVDGALNVPDPQPVTGSLFAPDPWWVLPGALTSITSLIALLALFVVPVQQKRNVVE